MEDGPLRSNSNRSDTTQKITLSESQSSLKEFTENFFKNLGCEMKWHGEGLEVSNVPLQFENFIGKKGPYVLTFDGSAHEGAEVVKKGSYFLVAMANFLKTKSKITLIKLDIKLEPEREILTRFTFPNAKIEKVSVRHDYDYVTRFMFGTNFQYLNEKEHETVPIFMKGGKLFDVDLMKLYPSVGGDKKDIELPDFSKEYEIAKGTLKKRVAGKIERIGHELNEMMQKELNRIETHYKQNVLEIDQQKNNLLAQIAKAEEEFQKKADDRARKRLEKLRETLAAFNGEERKKELEADLVLAIREEKNKYKLNVSHSLLNTSVIYYPMYELTVQLANERAKGKVTIQYDPVQKHMPAIECPGSGKKSYLLYLDDAGVACTKETIMECFESGKHYCSSSMKLKCAHSGRPIHASNAGVCAVTKKHFGKSYLKKDCVSGNNVYMNLLKYCPSCRGSTQEKNFLKCPSCGNSVCPVGLKKVFEGGVVKTRCGVCR